MLVRQVLNSKASQGVATVKPDTKISEAAGILAEKRIGTLVVAEDEKSPLGIISERDIVRSLAKIGANCISVDVSELMTRNVVHCTLDQSVDDVLAAMTKGRFRHMPVFDDGKMVGLISIGDAVKARLSELSMEKDALEGMIMGH